MTLALPAWLLILWALATVTAALGWWFAAQSPRKLRQELADKIFQVAVLQATQAQLERDMAQFLSEDRIR